MNTPRWQSALLAVTIVLGLILWLDYSEGEKQDLFSSPKDLSGLIQDSTAGTYQISCKSNWLGSGWGVKIENQYYVVTAFHVVEECVDGQEINARNEKTQMFELKLVAYDGRFWSSYFDLRDLAVLQAPGQINVLNIAKDTPSIGNWVAAMGYPFDSNEIARLSYTQGAVSSYDSRGLIVMDAAINGGSSGGPLINSRGEVVGTVFAADPTKEFEDLGFAQGMILHCGLAFQCSDGIPALRLPEKRLMVSGK